MKNVFFCYLKKNCAITVIFVLLMCMFFSENVNAAADTTAPIVKSIQFTPSSVKDNEPMTFTLDIEEQETGVEMIVIWFVHDEGSRRYLTTCQHTFDSDEEPFYSGKVTFKDSLISVGGGLYNLCKIIITDVAGNTRHYDNGMFDGGSTAQCKDSIGVYLPDDSDSSRKCRVSGSGQLTMQGASAATSSVKLNQAKLKQTSVKKGGKISVDFSVTDAANVKDIYMRLYCKKSCETIDETRGSQTWSRSGNTITVTWILPTNISAGEYIISDIFVKDSKGANIWYTICQEAYYADCSDLYLLDGMGTKCDISGNEYLNVQSDGDDEAPFLRKVSILTPEVKKPGVIKIRLETDDNTNVESIRVCLSSDNEKVDGTSGIDILYEKEFSGKAKNRTIIATFSVGTRPPECKIFINEVRLKDSSGNIRYYTGIVYDGVEENGVYVERKKTCQDETGLYIADFDDTQEKIHYGASPISIKEEFDVAFQLSLNNSNLLNKVKSMKEGEAGRIPIVAPYIASKNLFEAIKGKDKTLIFYKDNYQWVFNGKDINTPKNINLKIGFKMVDGTEYGNKSKLMQIDFYKNGTLPGKANVRIKSDYSYMKFGLNDSIYIYYNNTSKNQLQLEKNTNAKVLLDDTDRWLQFDITHNSQFLASKGKVGSTKSLALEKGKIYKSTKYKCYFKSLGNKELSYLKPISKSIKKLNLRNQIRINGIRYNIVAIEPKAFAGCKKLSRISSLGQVTKIGNAAFQNCSNLKIIEGQLWVETIGKNAFAGCEKLKEFLLGNYVEKIGAKAFYNCRSLKKIKLSGSVRKIGSQAFAGCDNLKSITVKTTKLTAKKVGKKAFLGISQNAVFKVPKAKKKAYKKIFRKSGAPKSIKVK